MHFTLCGDSIANTHLPDTKDFRVFHSVEPSRLLLCTDSPIYVSSSLLWWLPSVLGNTLGDTHTCVYPCKNHNLDICQDLQNLSSAFRRQMKRTQAAVRTLPASCYSGHSNSGHKCKWLKARQWVHIQSQGQRWKGKPSVTDPNKLQLWDAGQKLTFFEFSKGNRP